jgi:hypothetical protein
MSRLMTILGIVLAVFGLLLLVLSVVNPGMMQVYGVTPEAGAIFLVGGVLALGLGGVVKAVEQISITAGVIDSDEPMVLPKKSSSLSDVKQASASGSGRKGAEAAAVAATATVAAAAVASKSTVPSVADTISALEQAKSDIKSALGGMDAVTHGVDDLTPVPDAVAAPRALEVPAEAEEAEAAEEHAEGDLYVVEEKIIRGRPSRILSDDTVEAETDEGWMRFENLEHLNEYLDSVEEGEV